MFFYLAHSASMDFSISLETVFFIAHHLIIPIVTWKVFCNYIKDAPWGDIFHQGASLAAVESSELVWAEIYVYSTQGIYLVKPHLSPWFSSAFATAIVHNNHLFMFINRRDLMSPRLKEGIQERKAKGSQESLRKSFKIWQTCVCR